MSTLNRVPSWPVRLSPEQATCPHQEVRRIAKGIFRCIGPDGGCGAELVVPEYEENLGLSVASEPESDLERSRR